MLGEYIKFGHDHIPPNSSLIHHAIIWHCVTRSILSINKQQIKYKTGKKGQNYHLIHNFCFQVNTSVVAGGLYYSASGI